MIVKYDPCLSWTSSLNGVSVEFVIRGGVRVMVPRRTAWCCRALHPSVLRRPPHLHHQQCIFDGYFLLITLLEGKKPPKPRRQTVESWTIRRRHYQRMQKAISVASRLGLALENVGLTNRQARGRGSRSIGNDGDRNCCSRAWIGKGPRTSQSLDKVNFQSWS